MIVRIKLTVTGIKINQTFLLSFVSTSRSQAQDVVCIKGPERANKMTIPLPFHTLELVKSQQFYIHQG